MALPLDEPPEPLQVLVGLELLLAVVLRAALHHLLLGVHDFYVPALQHLPGGGVEVLARHVHPARGGEGDDDDVPELAGPLQGLHRALLAGGQLGLDALHGLRGEPLRLQRQLPVELEVFLNEEGRKQGVVPIEDDDRLLRFVPVELRVVPLEPLLACAGQHSWRPGAWLEAAQVDLRAAVVQHGLAGFRLGFDIRHGLAVPDL